MPQTLVLPKPDDWHLHLRDGATLNAVLPFSARHFARAIVMPNLSPPIITSAQVLAYRERILAALPPSMTFTPLMTVYLSDETDPEDLSRGYETGLVFAAKLYPTGSTTNAAHGVTDLQAIAPALDRIQRLGMPLLIHGEYPAPEIDFFDRESAFIDRVLIPLRRTFPGLKIVMEHITTRRAVQYVISESQSAKIAATITPHHLFLNRNALFDGGINPHHFCYPVLKREADRQAIVDAATSGAPMFFAGTDSAPHPRSAKETAHGAGGLFTAPQALSVYAEIFDRENALDRLENFLCLNGPAFYDLPVNAGTLTLEKTPPHQDSFKPILTQNGAEIVLFPMDESSFAQRLSWRVQDKPPY